MGWTVPPGPTCSCDPNGCWYNPGEWREDPNGAESDPEGGPFKFKSYKYYAGPVSVKAEHHCIVVDSGMDNWRGQTLDVRIPPSHCS